MLLLRHAQHAHLRRCNIEALKDAYVSKRRSPDRVEHLIASCLHRARPKKLAGIKTIEGKHWLHFVESIAPTLTGIPFCSGVRWSPATCVMQSTPWVSTWTRTQPSRHAARSSPACHQQAWSTTRLWQNVGSRVYFCGSICYCIR